LVDSSGRQHRGERLVTALRAEAVPRPATAGLFSALTLEAPLNEELGNLYGVGRRALAEVVADNPHVD